MHSSRKYLPLADTGWVNPFRIAAVSWLAFYYKKFT